MNLSKKHIRHNDYVEIYKATDADPVELRRLNYLNGKKSRKSMKDFRRDVATNAWQTRVYETTGINIMKGDKTS